MKTVEDVIQFVDTHEWTQKYLYNPRKNSYCLIGSIMAVCGFDHQGYNYDNFDRENYFKLIAEIREKVDTPYLASFNDKTGRTKEEVLEALRS